MIASQIINDLQIWIRKYGDLPVYTNDDPLNESGYNGESESSGIRFAKELDDREIDEEMYLPERFYIKT